MAKSFDVCLCLNTQDGRLRSGDLLLRIGDVDVSTMGSEEVARELRLAGSHVRLIIARETTHCDLSPTIAQQQDTQKKQVQNASDLDCVSMHLYVNLVSLFYDGPFSTFC